MVPRGLGAGGQSPGLGLEKHPPMASARTGSGDGDGGQVSEGTSTSSHDKPIARAVPGSRRRSQPALGRKAP